MADPFDEQSDFERFDPERPPAKKGWSTTAKVLFFLFAGGGLIVLLCCGGMIAPFMQGFNRARQAALDAKADGSGKAEFDAANRKISSTSGGRSAFGNTDEAEQLALKFSTDIHTLREAFFTKRKSKPLVSLSDGKFLTYCHLDENACVFMVHVPDLRKFDGDAKQLLADLAWETGQEVLRSLEKPPAKLAVATRGALLYDEVLIGDFIADGESADDGIRRRDGGKESLYEFFKTEPVAEPDTPDVPAAEKPVEDAVDPAKPDSP